jgi:hypothetical protein
MKFTDFWKKHYTYERIEKKLSQKELKTVRDIISEMEDKRRPAKAIIGKLGRELDDLDTKARAKQAYATESKRLESKYIKEDAEDLGIKKFRIELSPNACDACIAFTKNGSRIFYEKGLKKDGRDVPPIHPNCKCILVPVLK